MKLKNKKRKLIRKLEKEVVDAIQHLFNVSPVEIEKFSKCCHLTYVYPNEGVCCTVFLSLSGEIFIRVGPMTFCDAAILVFILSSLQSNSGLKVINFDELAE
jgi:hypothetical protein